MRRLRPRGDDGVYAILYALLVVVLLGMSAIVVDLSSLRADRRDSRNAADVASLAAVADLGIGPWTPRAACNSAWTYLWTSLNLTAPPASTNPCNGFQVSYATCPSGPITPLPTSAAYKGISVTFTWPIPSTSNLLLNPDGETANTPSRGYNVAFDGSAGGCDRFGVHIARSRTFGLAAGLGVASGRSAAESVARKTTNPGSDEFTYPLVVLDETTCTALSVGGTGANLLVTSGGSAFPNVAGRIAVDSNGTTSCGGQASILNVNGNTFIQTQDAVNVTSDPTLRGAIEVFGPSGLPAKTTAPGTAVPCNPGPAPLNTPCVGQTLARPSRVTRSPFDLAFKVPIDQLGAALSPVISTTGGWYALTGGACNANFTGTAALGSQYFVNCPAESNTWKLTKTWSFPSGSTVIVNGDLVLGSQGGNTGCFATNVDVAWSVANLCAGTFKPLSTTLTAAGVVQVRGAVDAQGAGNLILPGTFFNMIGRTGLNNPEFNGTSFSNIFWTAPYYANKVAAKNACDAAPTGMPAPQCFRNLAYWTETNAQNTIQGGASLTLEGTFFLGRAPLKVGGTGAISVTKSQFVARTIVSGGNKLLTFTPDPERTTGVPTYGVTLIR